MKLNVSGVSSLPSSATVTTNHFDTVRCRLANSDINRTTGRTSSLSRSIFIGRTRFCI